MSAPPVTPSTSQTFGPPPGSGVRSTRRSRSPLPRTGPTGGSLSPPLGRVGDLSLSPSPSRKHGGRSPSPTPGPRSSGPSQRKARAPPRHERGPVIGPPAVTPGSDAAPLSSRRRLQRQGSSNLWRRASEQVQKLASTESLLALPLENPLGMIHEVEPLREEEYAYTSHRLPPPRTPQGDCLPTRLPTRCLSACSLSCTCACICPSGNLFVALISPERPLPQTLRSYECTCANTCLHSLAHTHSPTLARPHSFAHIHAPGLRLTFVLKLPRLAAEQQELPQHARNSPHHRRRAGRGHAQD